MPSAARAQPPPFIRLAANPVRWQILTELATSDRRVRELVELTGEPQNLVSYHLRLLREAGLVTMRRSSHDGRDSYYHLDLGRCADALGAAAASLHPALGTTTAPRGTSTESGVLFVCTGNSARSPIAEALLRHHTNGRVPVASAGTAPKNRIHPHAVRVLRERFDIDIRDQLPRSVDEVTGTSLRVGRLITLCDKAREHIQLPRVRRRVHWSVPDPADTPGRPTYSSFVAVADDIDARVRHLIPVM
ncbi:MAG TPA: ArsR family transcriptional regulator [Nocardioides sp.]|nr:ArsR family transcriptional regulator [Nocardioides sp.]